MLAALSCPSIQGKTDRIIVKALSFEEDLFSITLELQFMY
jgi:hypothetical protein